MPNFIIKPFCLLILFSLNLTGTSFAQAPLPQPALPFHLPIADGTSATAVYLPTADGQASIVYATKNGHLGLLTITSKPNPTPTPTPPPEPPKPVQLSIVTVSETTPAELPADVKSKLAETRGTYHAFTVAMVAIDEPPTNALRYIGLSAGKSYPYTFLVDVDGKIHWQGPTPSTAAAFLELLSSPKPAAPIDAACPDGKCTPTRSRRR